MQIPPDFLLVIETVKVTRYHLVRAPDGDTAIERVDNCVVGEWAPITGSEQDIEYLEYESRELTERETRDLQFIRAYNEIIADNEIIEEPKPKPRAKRGRKSKAERDKELAKLAEVVGSWKKE